MMAHMRVMTWGRATTKLVRVLVATSGHHLLALVLLVVVAAFIVSHTSGKHCAVGITCFGRTAQVLLAECLCVMCGRVDSRIEHP